MQNLHLSPTARPIHDKRARRMDNEHLLATISCCRVAKTADLHEL